MEAVVGFLGLIGPAVQGVKFVYELTTTMKDCPKDYRDIMTNIELVEDLITEVKRQCNEENVQLRESPPLARTMRYAQESVEDLKKDMAAYATGGRFMRVRFAAKLSRTQKLRGSLDRAKTLLLEFKNQLQSDLLYDIRDTNQEILRSVKKSNSKLEASISSPPTSIPSTPALSREVSEISVMSSSQRTTASSVSSSISNTESVSHSAQQADILSKHPLIQFKDNQFHFLIAIIFTQRTSKHMQYRACQQASECLAAFPTPKALSEASPEALRQYFDGIDFYKVKPSQVIKLAQAYVKDPPRQGILRSKAKCLKSEISHLPRIGQWSVDTWLVYCCERTNVVTRDKTLLEYMEYLRKEAGAGFP